MEKGKDFEVIVPAYDALEAELEEILGGGCQYKCKEHLGCMPNYTGGCAGMGEEQTPERPCCTGLIPVKEGDTVVICMPQV